MLMSGAAMALSRTCNGRKCTLLFPMCRSPSLGGARAITVSNNTELNIIFGTFDDTLNGDILDDLKGWFHELTL